MTLAEKIVTEVARICEVNVDHVMSESRKATYTFARHACYHMLRTHLQWSTTEVGDFMHRDHSTVLYGSANVRGQVSTYEHVRKRMDFIDEMCAKLVIDHVYTGEGREVWSRSIPTGRIAKKLFTLKRAINHYREINHWIESQS